MKKIFTLISLLICSLVSWAQNQPVSPPKDTAVYITASFQNIPLQNAFVQLTQQYKVRFYYQPEWIAGKRVSGNFKAEPLRNVLRLWLQNEQLSFDLYHPYAALILPGSMSGSTFSIKNEPERDVAAPDKITIGDQRLVVASKKYTLSGYVKDATTGEPLMGATVSEKSTGIGDATDNKGFYSLVLPPGHHRLTFSNLGSETTEKVIALFASGTYNHLLPKESIQLTEVEVKDSRQSIDNLATIQSGITKLDLTQIKKMPAFMGEIDVVKSLKLMSGVSSIGEAASGFNVRGGNVDQNLILLDNAPIFNSSHLFGFFSVFNPDAVQDVTLYKGGIPAQYGGRVSAVLDVKQKEGDFQKWQANGGFGPITGRLAVQGPVIKNKTSVLLAGRSSYSDWILKRMKDPELKQSQAFFYDLTAKVSHKLSATDKITLSAYNSQDNFGFALDTLYKWNNQTVSLQYGHTFSNKFFLDINAVYADYKFRINIDEPNNASVYKNGINQQSVQATFNYLTGLHQVSFGGIVSRYNFALGNIRPNSAYSQIIPLTIPDKQAREAAVFVNDEFDITPRLSMLAGIRYSIYQNTGPGKVYIYDPNKPRSEQSITDTVQYTSGQAIKTYGGLEPRLSFRYRLTENASLKAGYNRIRQYLHLVSNTAAASPMDIWTTSSNTIKPQLGDQVSLGYFRNLAQNQYETSVEVYFKKIQNILDYKNGAVLYLNPTLDADLLQGNGRAYGAELTATKKSGRLSGWVNYTYSRIRQRVTGERPEETTNQGQYYSANFEKPHTVNMVSNYQISRRVNFGANFTYSTGRPITAPISYYKYDVFSVPNFALRNQYRIPDYHRLDLSLGVQTGCKKNKKWAGSWNFSIYNVYARKNAYSVFFKKEYGSPARPYRLAVVGTLIPSVTYDFKF